VRPCATKPLSVAAVALVALAASPSSGHAANPLLDDAPPTLPTRPLHDGRHHVAPAFAFTVGDPYAHNVGAGVFYRYYLDSWLGIGADVLAGGSVRTALSDDIVRELSRPDAPFEFDTTALRTLATLAIELVPFSGKALLFSESLVHWDLHLTGGAGVAMVAGEGRVEDSVSLAPFFGVGTRFFPTRGISVGFEVRDYFVNRALSSRKDGSVPASSWGQNWLGAISVGFSFPTEPPLEE
jgi:outer membrane beta-barrel protein